MKSNTIHFETLGCKLNQIESESIARCCAECGFCVTMGHETAAAPPREEPLLSIINTCTVTAKAEQKARRIIRLLLAKFPQSAVLVTGCYAEVEREALAALDGRVVVVPGSIKDELADFPQFLRGLLASGEELGAKALCERLKSWPPLQSLSAKSGGAGGNASGAGCADNTSNARGGSDDSSISGSSRKSESGGIGGIGKNGISANALGVARLKPTVAPAFRLATDTFYQHSRASIKIQDGCANRCSFCRICIARGKPVSLQAAEVLARVRQIEAAGQREVVVTGVNLTQYQSFVEQNGERRPCDLAVLLEYLLENTQSISFRISSLYPERVDDALCKVIAHARIRPHFHLSVQSGSDAVLRAMRRPYSAQDVVQAVQKLRAAKSGAFIACDIIAGFPGETDADFEATKALCKACRFTWIHAFPFSPRPGTAAYAMKGQVPQRVAAERVEWLTAEARANKFAYAASFEGKTLKAIVEKRRSEKARAVTENFLHIELEGDHDELMALGGREVLVRITQALPTTGSDDECEACGKQQPRD